MPKNVKLVLLLPLCVFGMRAQQTTPAGQTPAGVPGSAPTPASQTPANTPARNSPAGQAATPQSGTAPYGGPAGNSPADASPAGLTRPTAPPAARDRRGNSSVDVTGNSTPGKPTDDHPILPIAPLGNALGIRSGTPIRVHLDRTADSGTTRNGDVLTGALAAPLAGLKAGTPVQLTVVQAAKAGSLSSAGELSLQVTMIGSHAVLSEIVTALGKPGAREVADAAAAVGTEAVFAAGQDFSFPAA